MSATAVLVVLVVDLGGLVGTKRAAYSLPSKTGDSFVDYLGNFFTALGASMQD